MRQRGDDGLSASSRPSQANHVHATALMRIDVVGTPYKFLRYTAHASLASKDEEGGSRAASRQSRTLRCNSAVASRGKVRRRSDKKDNGYLLLYYCDTAAGWNYSSSCAKDGDAACRDANWAYDGMAWPELSKQLPRPDIEVAWGSSCIAPACVSFAPIISFDVACHLVATSV